GAPGVNARIALEGREIGIDAAHPVSLAVELDFTGPQPRHFAAPRASARPFEAPGFAGSVERGASCNCEVLTLIPHCNGTHTECAGHLTRERLDAYRLAPVGLVPALLVSVTPVPGAECDERSLPLPQPRDLLVTRAALARAVPAALPFTARALVIRTLPNTPDKRVRDYSGQTPPYLTQEAAGWLVERGIMHLIVDLPSIDRAQDEGRLTAHRIFFGLPPAVTQLAAATRAAATVTELAYIPESVADGPYLLELQVPALGGDAVPSRPLLYRLTDEAG
ncbi:MAG TPA: cyclase family protein, partial [Steroidobacteraceae bacterium]|nr:cyclase family protein [Steroidobacteraceae bacterium]